MGGALIVLLGVLVARPVAGLAKDKGAEAQPAAKPNRDGAAADKLLKGLPEDVAQQARTVLVERDKAIAEANQKAAEALLTLAKDAEATDQKAAIALYRILLRVKPDSAEAAEALKKAGVALGDGKGIKAGPKDGEGPAKTGPKDGEGPAKTGPKDGEGPPKAGPKEG
jgi:hypothetical protein